MLGCMRTTIRLDDALLAEAKQRAAERGTTFTAIVEDALRQALAQRAEPRSERSSLPTFGGDGVRAGIDLDDSAGLRDIMEGLGPA